MITGRFLCNNLIYELMRLFDFFQEKNSAQEATSEFRNESRSITSVQGNIFRALQRSHKYQTMISSRPERQLSCNVSIKSLSLIVPHKPKLVYFRLDIFSFSNAKTHREDKFFYQPLTWEPKTALLTTTCSLEEAQDRG